jgi:single stranded DNA-binding protein
MDIQSINLNGRLGSAPVALKGNAQGCTFSLANTVGYGDNQRTVWYNVIVFGKQSEYILNTFAKGDQVLVSGSFQPKEYTTRNNETRWNFDIISQQVVRIKAASTNADSSHYNAPQSAQTEKAYLPTPKPQVPVNQTTTASADDELPF